MKVSGVPVKHCDREHSAAHRNEKAKIISKLSRPIAHNQSINSRIHLSSVFFPRNQMGAEEENTRPQMCKQTWTVSWT